MTKLTFPSANFSGTPTQSTFAAGGFFGGLLRVGADGCIYATQGRMVGGSSSVRYGDSAVAPNDSVVRICSDFAASPGVAGREWSPEPGSVSGSTFSDWNRNGVRDAGEPGLAGVLISLSGSNTGSATTDGNGNYVLTDVASGLYSVSAPVTIGSLSGNPTPLAVTLGSGEHQVGVDFPYTDSTVPACTSSAPSGSPTRVDFALRDDNALRRIVVRAVSNFQVSVRGGSPVTGPVTVDFPTAATGDVSVTATRSNAAQAASVQIQGVDAFGNQVACAANIPASTTPPEPPKPPVNPPKPGGGDSETIRRELTGRGRFDVEIARHVAGNMRFVTVRNGRNGLEGVEILVNHRWFLTGRLRDGQVKSLDIRSALKPGQKNRIILVGQGRSHDSAVVTISSKP
jgi:hypothetical protein